MLLYTMAFPPPAAEADIALNPIMLIAANATMSVMMRFLIRQSPSGPDTVSRRLGNVPSYRGMRLGPKVPSPVNGTRSILTDLAPDARIRYGGRRHHTSSRQDSPA